MWFGAIYSFHALHEIKFCFWSLGTLGIFIWKEIPKPTNQTIFSRKLLRYIKEDFHLPIKNSSIHVRILFSIFGVAVGLNFDIPNFRIKSRVNFRWTFHLEKKSTINKSLFLLQVVKYLSPCAQISPNPFIIPCVK